MNYIFNIIIDNIFQIQRKMEEILWTDYIYEFCSGKTKQYRFLVVHIN